MKDENFHYIIASIQRAIIIGMLIMIYYKVKLKGQGEKE